MSHHGLKAFSALERPRICRVDRRRERKKLEMMDQQKSFNSYCGRPSRRLQEKPQLVADYGWFPQPLILKRLRSSWVVPRVTISWIISWDHSQSGNIAVSIEGDPGGLTVGLERLRFELFHHPAWAVGSCEAAHQPWELYESNSNEPICPTRITTLH